MKFSDIQLTAKPLLEEDQAVSICMLAAAVKLGAKNPLFYIEREDPEKRHGLWMKVADEATLKAMTSVWGAAKKIPDFSAFFKFYFPGVIRPYCNIEVVKGGLTLADIKKAAKAIRKTLGKGVVKESPELSEEPEEEPALTGGSDKKAGL